MMLTRTSDAAPAAASRLKRTSGVFAPTIDRRTFLKRSGMVAGAGAFASQLPYGAIQPAGLMGRDYCVIPYKDAGKTCANDADCEGQCWISGVAAGPNPDVRGQCQPTNMPFGCNASLDKGVVSPVLCVD